MVVLCGRGLIVYLYVLLLHVQDLAGYFGLTSREPILTLNPTFDERMRDLEQGQKVTSVDLCNMLALQKKQRRQCSRGKGVAETLVKASRLAALECQHQFEHERWNCSLGDFRKHILKKGFKETAFLFAVSSAGLVHEVARACARGAVDRCTCDESKHLANTETWRWGGCGDNIRFGMKFTRKFLHGGKRSEKDIRARVDEHNSGAGIKIVKDLVNTTCKCHGVSGSCTVRTCWLQLAPFKTVGNVLKSKYEKSAKVISYPNQATGQTQLMRRRSSPGSSENTVADTDIVPLRKSELTYIESSPNFCLNSSYSPGTAGRSCVKGENCDTICCGRGYNVQKQIQETRCKCEAIWCCKITCKVCLFEKEVYLCK